MSSRTAEMNRASDGGLSDRIRGWSVLIVGLLLGVVSVVGTFIDGPGGQWAFIALPLAASLGIVGAGVWIRHDGLTVDDIAVVAVWIATTSVLFGSVAMTAAFVMTDDPVAVGVYLTTFVAPIGAAGGGAAGYSDARRRKQHRITSRTERALETATDGIAILNKQGEYVTVNDAHAAVYGYEDPAEMIGESWEVCYTDAEADRIGSEVFPVLDERNEWRGEATGKRTDGTTFPQELTLTRMEDGGIVCIARDITERDEREQQLRQQKRRLQTIVENVPIVLFAFEPDGTITLSEGRLLSKLGLEPGQAVGDSMFDMYAPVPEVIEACERALEGDTVHRTADLGPIIVESWMTPVTDDTGTVTQVIGTAMDITEQQEREQQLAALYEASRELTYTNTLEGIAETTVEIAETVLDNPIATLWRYDEPSDSLRAVAMSDDAGELLEAETVDDLPPIESDQLGMDVFRSDETRLIPEYQAIENRSFDASLGSMLIVPLGDHGVLIVGRQAVDAIDSQDKQQAEILGLNAQASLARAQQERLLRERTDELEMRTSQMEFINSILRHDILNGMTVIRARAEFLEADLEGQHNEYAETIVKWCDDISEFVERVQTVLDALSDEDTVSLKPVEVTALVEKEFEQLRQTYPGITFDASLPEEALVLADELLDDMLSNIARNAVEHNETDDLRVTAAVEPGPESTRIRISDNGSGIPSENHEMVFRRGESHAKSTGSGFGLFFVDVMVDAYGGDIRIEDNDPGTAFVIELPAPTARSDDRPKSKTKSQ